MKINPKTADFLADLGRVLVRSRFAAVRCVGSDLQAPGRYIGGRLFHRLPWPRIEGVIGREEVAFRPL